MHLYHHRQNLSSGRRNKIMKYSIKVIVIISLLSIGFINCQRIISDDKELEDCLEDCLNDGNDVDDCVKDCNN